MNPQLVKLLKVIIAIAVLAIGSFKTIDIQARQYDDVPHITEVVRSDAGLALQELPVKGRAPKTGYTRSQFSAGWDAYQDCDVRNYILARDMTNDTFVLPTCKLASGTLQDPYTAKTIEFKRGPGTSSVVQIDHVVALSDAWQKGAQLLTYASRHALANDPLNLLAVDGKANQDKGDADAASWLPPNKQFRCEYVARQIAVKKKYQLWVTASEHDAIANVLSACPEQQLPGS